MSINACEMHSIAPLCLLPLMYSPYAYMYFLLTHAYILLSHTHSPLFSTFMAFGTHPYPEQLTYNLGILLNSGQLKGAGVAGWQYWDLNS